MLEHGAYTMLLDRYYATEQGIPADQVHRLCRARTPEEVAAVDVVLSEFFSLVDGRWINGRAEREIEAAMTRINAAKENGKLGGRPRKTQHEPTGNPLGLQQEPRANPAETQSEPSEKLSNLQSPISNLQEQEYPPTPRKRGSVSEFPPGFAEFWEVYPRHTAKANAQKAWAKLRPDPATVATILRAVEAQKQSSAWLKDGGQFIPHPATWLNGRRWEDEAPTVRPVGVVL